MDKVSTGIHSGIKKTRRKSVSIMWVDIAEGYTAWVDVKKGGCLIVGLDGREFDWQMVFQKALQNKYDVQPNSKPPLSKIQTWLFTSSV